MSWLNKDGLYLKYGTEKATTNKGGEFHNDGPLHCLEVKIDLTTLTSSATIVSDAIFFPKNARIEEIHVIADTAATSGGSATLDIGLQQTDRSTEIDYNGFVAALAKTAIDASGEKNKITVGSTGAGALIGTTNSTVGYLTANYNTASFTAGVVFVRIFYYNR